MRSPFKVWLINALAHIVCHVKKIPLNIFQKMRISKLKTKTVLIVIIFMCNQC